MNNYRIYIVDYTDIHKISLMIFRRLDLGDDEFLGFLGAFEMSVRGFINLRWVGLYLAILSLVVLPFEDHCLSLHDPPLQMLV